MTRVISIVNQKGGVGKTTTAVNLSAALAELGQKTLLIDFDPQANATSHLGVDHRQLPFTIYDVLSGRASLKEATHPLIEAVYHLGPASPDLAGANIELSDQKASEREWLLYQALREALGEYDFIIIDCPPSLGLLTINTLTAAEEIIIPVQTEYFALEGLSDLLKTVQLVRENLKPGLSILGALLTMYDDRHKLTRDVFEELYRYFSHRIFRTVIPRNIKLAEAPSYGLPVTKFAPQSRGARAYRKLAQEIILT